MGIYVGKGNQTPIYTTVERQDNLCYANYEEYFSSINLTTLNGSVSYTDTSSIEKLEFLHTPWSSTSPSNKQMYTIATLTAAIDIPDLQLKIASLSGWIPSVDTWNVRIYVDDTLVSFYQCPTSTALNHNTYDLANISAGSVVKLMISASNSSTDTNTYPTNRLDFQFTATRTYTEQEITGYETIPAVKSVTDIYTGKTGEVPIYEEQETTVQRDLSMLYFDKFFSLSETDTSNKLTYEFADSGTTGEMTCSLLCKYRSGVTNLTLTALQNITNFNCSATRTENTTSSSYKASVFVGSNSAVTIPYSTSPRQVCSGVSLNTGDTVVFQLSNSYSKSSYSFILNVTFSCNAISETDLGMVQVGTEIRPIAKKIKKGYVGVNGIAKLFFNKANDISYTGEYTVSDVSISGINYKLYTLTTSGSLTVNGESQYWICGGGASGNTSNMLPMSGGTNGGGGGYTATGILNAGAYNVTIGAGGQGSSDSSSDGNITSIGGAITANGGKYLTAEGGSGGGEGVASFFGLGPWTGTGSGISTIPFGIESLNPHCAGGGAGSYYASGSNSTTRYIGGAGGTNGGNGANMKSVSFGNQKKGIGGSYGGGDGGEYINSNNNTEATSATFYGGGGGGSYYHENSSSTTKIGSPGNGYQGVAYILIPA